MNQKQVNAVELLLCHPDATVAEMLGVRLSTLKRWMIMPEFAAALRERERDQKASANRLARQAVVNAAASICQTANEPGKADTKILLDVLKASGAFDEKEVDPGEALAEVIRQVTAEEVQNEAANE